MDGRIVLDDKSFKALSADSRVSILKSLKERRRTLSELSQKLELGNSTIKEHCDILVNADLIKQIDEGRKWKYYELTQKGKQIITPNLMDEIKVLIMLCIGVFAIGGLITMFLTGFMPESYQDNGIYSMEMTPNTQISNDAPMLAKTVLPEDRMMQATGTENQTMMTDDYNETPSNNITREFYAMSIILSMIFGIIVGWIFLRK